MGQWVRTVPELEQEPRQAVAYGSPAALYPGVEGASQRVGSVRHERFSNRDRTRGSDLRGRRRESRNVSGPAIRRTNSFEVKFRIGKVSHNRIAQLDPLFVVFDSQTSARSFHIDWTIYTDSLPRPVQGRCHVIVEHETSA